MIALTLITILLSGLIIATVGMLKPTRKRSYKLKTRPMYFPHGYRGKR